MVELVDTLGSGPRARKGVQVQVLFWAKRGQNDLFFIACTEILERVIVFYRAGAYVVVQFIAKSLCIGLFFVV